MSVAITRMLSCRIPEGLMQSIEEEAKRQNMTVTNTVMAAMKEYLTRENRTGNMDLLLFHLVKVQSIVERVIDPDGTRITKELRERIEEDATAYLKERRKA